MQLTIGREEVLLFVTKGNKMDTIIYGNGRLLAGQGMQPGCFVSLRGTQKSYVIGAISVLLT